MIRATQTQSIKTIASSGMLGQSKELCYGSDDGLNAAQLHVMSETEWLANLATNAGSTITIVPSDGHNGPTA